MKILLDTHIFLWAIMSDDEKFRLYECPLFK
jgi:PIN domain nuclease of toxin-antitoxin system